MRAALWLLYGFVLVGIVALWSGCASYTLEAKNVSLYNEGVKILDSIQPKSKVRIEVGQGKVGGSSGIPLAIFVLAQNLANQPTIFDKTNVRIYQNNQEIPALSEGELKTDSYDFGSVIESYHLYLPPAPMPDVPVGIPFVYRGYMGGFYVYDYMIISARERMQQQMRLDENRAKRAIILASVLQKNTLEPKGIPKGGFMLYAPSGFKEGLIQVSVSVNGEIHSFELELKK
nr:hypothetical protein [uncultured Helicobacter sp.]